MKIQSEFYFSIVPEWLIESKVSDGAFRVYATLCRFADKEDGSCYPSIKTIGNRCGKSPSSVKRALKELKDLGIIKVEERYIDDKGQTSNLYTVIYDQYKTGVKNGLIGESKSGLGGSSNMDYKLKKNNQSHIVKADKSGRKEMFRALCDSIGFEPQTKSEIGGFNKVVKEITEAGGTVDQIHERVNVYKKKWKGMTITPYAISKNWTILGEMVEENREPIPYSCEEKGHKWIDLEYGGDYEIYQCLHCKIEKSNG